MSSDRVLRTPPERTKELVIVRRRMGSGRHETHGGIWKIAYADFMTAMMAFFLVMWLLNATDKQTIAAVANYFNPVKLTDNLGGPRGLHDMEANARDEFDESLSAKRASASYSKSEVRSHPSYSEEALFADHHRVLEQLARKTDEKTELNSTRASSDIAWRDPFNPEFGFLIARANASEAIPQEPDRDRAVDTVSERPSTFDDNAALETSRDTLHSEVKAESESAETNPPESPESAEPLPTEKPEPRPAHISVAEDIRRALSEAALAKIPHVEVVRTVDGILISLTDEFDFGMFAIASAEPRPELVVIMEKIARVLKDYPGRLIVRGHTDGRPFRTQHYDNWRLSTARAHMAYFLLTRGGVDERRFERIEGHADRSLKVAHDPEAAQNRRIEILLRSGEQS
jgi:chemotaxis protein MotB